MNGCYMSFAGFAGLATDVTSDIRERILSGRLSDGERIVERELAEELGVSRGPIRDALRLLEAEGLVITSPRRGSRVSLPTGNDAGEIFAIRAALEPVAATMLVERGDPAAFAALDDAITKLGAAVGSGDWPQAIHADMHFHGTIFRYSGSRRLKRIWDGMNTSLLHIFRGHRPLYRSIEDVLPRHIEYLEVLRRGDPAEVAQHACEHVIEFRDRFLAQLADPHDHQP
jgi:DNA-binding GntR family transcriptional regulator